jgi:hypothetical protein
MTGPIEPHETWRMEQFSRAYVKAVASVAGCKLEWNTVDDDSVDGTLKRRNTQSAVRSPCLDFQLKCTAQDCLQADGVHFPLSLKNYNDLRPENLAVPRILIVILVPLEIENWTLHTEAELALRRCGYWISLRRCPATPNISTKTVTFPRIQTLDPSSLCGIFLRLEQGLLP